MLPIDEVHVWIWRSSTDLVIRKAHHELLSNVERQQAARYVFDRDRTRYVGAHAGLRVVLSSLLGIRAAEIRLSTDQNGKPRLEGEERPPLFFNLSHSHDLAAIAVSASFDIGLDIEMLRDADFAGVMTLFSRIERAALEQLPLHARTNAILRLWTCKEAFMKAVGLGLTMALDSFDVSVDPDDVPRVRRVAEAPHEPDRWQMVSLALTEGYVGTVAARSSGWHVVLHEITLDR